MKKSKKSQKKRRRFSGGVSKETQRQPRPLLSEEDYSEQLRFGATGSPGGGQTRPSSRGAGARRVADSSSPRRGGPSNRPSRGQVPSEPGHQPGRVSDDSRPPRRQPEADGSQGNVPDSFREMKRTGRGNRRPGPPSARMPKQQPMPSEPRPPRQRPAQQPNPNAGNRLPSAPANSPVPGQAASPQNNNVRDVVEPTQTFQRVNPSASSDSQADVAGQVRSAQVNSESQRNPKQHNANPSLAPHKPLHRFDSPKSSPPAQPLGGGSPKAAEPNSLRSDKRDAGPPTQAFQVDSLVVSEDSSQMASVPPASSKLGPDKSRGPRTRERSLAGAASPAHKQRASKESAADKSQQLASTKKKRAKKPLPSAGTKRRPPKKPSEPTKAMLAIAVSTIVVVFFGVATFLFFRGQGGDTAASSPSETDGSVSENADGEIASEESASQVSPEGAPIVVVANDAAALGPLASGTEYEMVADGVADGASLRYVIDGEPQTDSFTDLPALTLNPGRHTVALEQTVGETVTVGNAVAVYVLDETPARSYRANLRSVDIEGEGWAFAVEQFDLLKETHPDLKLTPSDPYPSLTPGYWNLYVDGFDNSEEANGYCEASGLAIPDACFSKLFDPAAPAE